MQGRAQYNEYIDGGRNARLLEHSVAYRVLIRSYQDSDGDGLGDLTGLIGRLDYIAELGVDVIVLSLYELTHQGDQAKPDDLMSLSTRLGTMLQL
ncbi:alpha-amylase family glycosyl hydrolase, partial [Candidatus Saccharibacteria bacterium]|nr:alpha-amylase family glycosyl hydrolase [Candidatus Saccharibacteria bacterium]